jgi:hypothetical protein
LPAWRGKPCTSKELWKYAEICACRERHAALPGKHDLIQAPIQNLHASVRQRLLNLADKRKEPFQRVLM